MIQTSQPKLIFFGTDPLAKEILDTLKEGGYLPALIVAAKDTSDNKKNIIFPTEKKWAIENNISIIQPDKITKEVIDDLRKSDADLFIVASYGKMLPEELLTIPRLGVLNVHPSLLPKLRGPSPMRSTILNDEPNTGVSIMLLNNKMDEGGIIAQEKITIDPWPQPGKTIDQILATIGGKLLAEVLPKFINREIKPVEQNHMEATYCREFTKQDGLINLNDNGYKNYLKICAFDGWPGTYFFIKHKDNDLRVKITDAEFVEGKLILKKVIPEGKKEMPYGDFLRGHEINF